MVKLFIISIVIFVCELLYGTKILSNENRFKKLACKNLDFCNSKNSRTSYRGKLSGGLVYPPTSVSGARVCVYLVYIVLTIYQVRSGG